MSRFIDKLNKVSQAAPQPMGFRATQPVSSKLKMQLVASIAEANVDSLADYVAGADAGLLHISKLTSGAKALQKISKAVPDIAWGGWLKESDERVIKQMVNAGSDFVVFPASTPLTILQNGEVGKILEVESSLSEGLMRTVNELPVDAVLIAAGPVEYLTWHHLMFFQRFAALLTKPLLVIIPSNVTASELQVLWETGVDGVVIEVGIELPEDRLKELRQAIDELDFPARRQKKAEALLPHITSGRDVVTEEEE